MLLRYEHAWPHLIVSSHACSRSSSVYSYEITTAIFFMYHVMPFFSHRSFNFEDTRVDEALRMYLESFRMPGEAPVISWLMEHFAEHWHVCNLEI